ncbi:MAG: DMT family transporter [Methanocorpusculum sp.]|nr:DMT family transporter [Methanocorpusculum sp.]MDE2518994.1 DMT family transporter [Methanocorpusculum sp.]MDE2522473.1 DMT family transporter [Methanocorpusculum sp.]MDE2523531.1 DMT family transporter [Methanocorpusculum sp.]
MSAVIAPRYLAIGFAVLAAVLYGISSPVSKVLLDSVPPALLAALLYLGAGIGMAVVSLIQTAGKQTVREAPVGRKDLPYVIGMIVLDIAAPVLLMFGLTMTTAANASLLNNFEIVTTSVIALLIFREAIDRRLWLAIILIVCASILLTIEDMSSFAFSAGSILVLLACVAWGFENNCTRMLSLKDPVEIVIIKGFGAGGGALLLALVAREMTADVGGILAALLLGFFAYGLSIYFYVLAQRSLGAARTSAFYAVAPFIGVGLSFVIFQTPLTVSFAAATVIMIAGAYFAATGGHRHRHVHTLLTHEHRHRHDDEHHTHDHDPPVEGEHSHLHTHEDLVHNHPHAPDLHHIHGHKHQ